MKNELKLQLFSGGYEKQWLTDSGLLVVQWPESQELCELGEDWHEHCFLINDEEGLSVYGSAAYVVQSNWYNENCNNSN